MTVDRKRLRELALAATPGPWRACQEGRCPCGMLYGGENPIATITRGKWGDTYATLASEGPSIMPTFKPVIEMIEYGHVPDDAANANGAFLAAANPQTILALLDALEAAEHSIASPSFEVQSTED